MHFHWPWRHTEKNMQKRRCGVTYFYLEMLKGAARDFLLAAVYKIASDNLSFFPQLAAVLLKRRPALCLPPRTQLTSTPGTFLGIYGIFNQRSRRLSRRRLIPSKCLLTLKIGVSAQRNWKRTVRSIQIETAAKPMKVPENSTISKTFCPPSRRSSRFSSKHLLRRVSTKMFFFLLCFFCTAVDWLKMWTATAQNPERSSASARSRHHSSASQLNLGSLEGHERRSSLFCRAFWLLQLQPSGKIKSKPQHLYFAASPPPYAFQIETKHFPDIWISKTEKNHVGKWLWSIIFPFLHFSLLPSASPSLRFFWAEMPLRWTQSVAAWEHFHRCSACHLEMVSQSFQTLMQ